MNIYVYGDESGVFDKKHYDNFVMGGLIFFSKNDKEVCCRKYRSMENKLQQRYDGELKAVKLSKKHRRSLFNCTNNYLRYAFVVDQRKVHDKIAKDKKSRQRYLDYVFKVGLKRVLVKQELQQAFNPNDIEDIIIQFDEHTTATNGCYELAEAIEYEFKKGTYNFEKNGWYPPVFPNMKGSVITKFIDSNSATLIRASDIIANRSYRLVVNDNFEDLNKLMEVVRFP